MGTSACKGCNLSTILDKNSEFDLKVVIAN